MIEIIKREEGKKSEKERLQPGRTQISYNSDGHLVIRIIHDNKSDTLIVCNPSTSDEIIEFCNLIKRANLKDIPF